MTAASKEFTEHIVDLLEPLGAVDAKRFFGGIGLRQAGSQFAMIMGDTLYFAVDDTSRAKFRDAGSQPFSYTSKRGRVVVERYYAVPPDILDEEEALLDWARAALAAANSTTRSNKRTRTAR